MSKKWKYRGDKTTDQITMEEEEAVEDVWNEVAVPEQSVLLGSVATPSTPLLGHPVLVKNEDGQIAVVTQAEITIFTPSLGIHAQELQSSTGAIKGSLTSSMRDKEDTSIQLGRRLEIPLLRTSFKVNKEDVLDWSLWSNEQRIVTGVRGPGQLVVPHFRTVSFSPTSVCTGSGLGNTSMAVLTSNKEVLIYEAAKNPMIGEWTEVYDITSHLAHLLLPAYPTLPRDGYDDKNHAMKVGIEQRKNYASDALVKSEGHEENLEEEDAAEEIDELEEEEDDAAEEIDELEEGEDDRSSAAVASQEHLTSAGRGSTTRGLKRKHDHTSKEKSKAMEYLRRHQHVQETDEITTDQNEHQKTFGAENETGKSKLLRNIEQRHREAVKIFECQATAIAWSPRVTLPDSIEADWSLNPPQSRRGKAQTVEDYSILAVGHKSGHLSLWRRYQLEGLEGSTQMEMRILHRYRIDRKASAITTLSWSPWRVINKVRNDDGGQTAKKCMACLAVADASGALWNIEVYQDLYKHEDFTLDDTGSSKEPYPGSKEDSKSEDDDDGVRCALPQAIVSGDRKLITRSTWTTQSEQSPTLLFTKIGALNVTRFQEDSTSAQPFVQFPIWKTKELELHTEGNWAGSTRLSPCTAIEYLSEYNAAIIALSDGSLHAVDLNSEEPCLITEVDQDSIPSKTIPSSAILTHYIRMHFLEVRGRHRPKHTVQDRLMKSGKVSSRDVGTRLTGLTGLFGLTAGELCWIYENDSPDSQTYEIASLTNTIMVMTKIFNGTTLDDIVREMLLTRALVLDARYFPPAVRLQSILQVLQNHFHESEVQERFIDILRSDSDRPKFLVEAPVLPNRGVPNHIVSKMMRDLIRNFYVEDLRLRVVIATFLLSKIQQQDGCFEDIRAIHWALTRQLVTYIVVSIGIALSEGHGLLNDEELKTEQRLMLASGALRDLPLARWSDYKSSPDGLHMSPEDLPMTFSSIENCPACEAEVPFSNLKAAVCIAGHVWERCSVTLGIISVTSVRTCAGCGRKCLLNNVLSSQSASEAFAVSLVEKMLNAITCCLYCGGRWIKLR